MVKIKPNIIPKFNYSPPKRKDQINAELLKRIENPSGLDLALVGLGAIALAILAIKKNRTQDSRIDLSRQTGGISVHGVEPVPSTVENTINPIGIIETPDKSEPIEKIVEQTLKPEQSTEIPDNPVISHITKVFIEEQKAHSGLEEPEILEHCTVRFDIPLSEHCIGNRIDLNWYFNKFVQSEVTKQVLAECENVTFDTPNLVLMKDKYDANNVYDLGLRFAVVANNTAQAKGNSVLINEIPPIFRNVDIKELTRILDELPSRLEHNKINEFSVSGKKFFVKPEGGGCISSVYKMYDEFGNKVCFKYSINPYLMGRGQGIYNETAILNEAIKAGVTDVPKLYMTNPVGCIAQRSDSIGTTVKGSWQILEFIDKDKSVPKNGLKFADWLESKGLEHRDLHLGNYVGDYIVDVGGVIDNAETIGSIEDSGHDISWLFRAMHNNYSVSDILKMLQ